jgi:pimeloyl-ACP methyl ester carboxylesterase
VKGIVRARPVLDAAMGLPGGKAVLRPLLRWAYGRAGFSPSISDDARIHTVQVIDRAVFERHADRVSAIRAPTLVAWAEDDRLVDPDIIAELAEIVPDGPRLVFPEGGHAVQKSRALEIGQALLRWVPGL